jgi:hypothetical protein
MATGRTVTKWTRFAVTDHDGSAREIPVDSISPVGFTYDEVDLTAYQDAVKGYLANHPDATIDITGPFDDSAEVGLAASTLAPTLTGSHTVLSLVGTAGWTAAKITMGLWIAFGVRGYWTAAVDPVFGVVAPSLTNGYVCTKYVVEGSKYSARFVPYPGTVPAWGTAILVGY